MHSFYSIAFVVFLSQRLEQLSNFKMYMIVTEISLG